MRSGSVELDGVVERFRCGPDGDGWAYAGVRADPTTGHERGRLHLRLDAQGVTTRLHVESGGWVVRGGCVGDSVLWRRAGAAGEGGGEEHEAAAAGFFGTSPAYIAALVRRFPLAVGESVRVRLVEVTAPVLACRCVDRSWSRSSPDVWALTDLATGEREAVGPALTLL